MVLLLQQVQGRLGCEMRGERGETAHAPLMLASTSMRGRPSSSSGSSSNRTMRPVPSFIGLAPTSASRIPTLSPFVLMASSPHSDTATVSGYAPSASLSRCDWRMDSAIYKPRSMAAGDGIR